MEPEHAPAEPHGMPPETGPVAYPAVPEQRRALTSGVLGGLAGALAFALFCTVVFAMAGDGFWKPLNLVAHTFWSGAPDDASFDPGAALLGLLIIVIVGVAMAVPIAMLVHNIGPPHWAMVLALTIVIPNVLWVIGHGAVWPTIDEQAAEQFTSLWSWLGHAVYGLVLGLVLLATGPQALRPFGRRERGARALRPFGRRERGARA